jgi:hypothetical protein
VIRGIARLLWDVARTLPHPERDRDLGPFYTDLRRRWQRDPRLLPPEAWEEGLLELIAERIAEGWDRHGAPSAARDPEGEGYIASFEGPGDPVTVKAETKREAYRTARKLWIKRLLKEDPR